MELEGRTMLGVEARQRDRLTGLNQRGGLAGELLAIIG